MNDTTIQPTYTQPVDQAGVSTDAGNQSAPPAIVKTAEDAIAYTNATEGGSVAQDPEHVATAKLQASSDRATAEAQRNGGDVAQTQAAFDAAAVKLGVPFPTRSPGGPGGPEKVEPPKVDETKVKDAADKITELLKKDGNARNDALHDINGVIDGLGSAERKATYEALSNRDIDGVSALHLWGQRIGYEPNGIRLPGQVGLNGEEQQKLFEKLVPDMSGAQLAELSHGLKSGGDASGASIRLAKEVGLNGGADKAVEYVKELAKQDGFNAAAAAEVLGVSTGKQFDGVVAALSTDQLGQVLAQIPTTTLAGAGDQRGEFAVSVLQQAKRSDDPAVQAKVFQAALETVESFKSSREADPRYAIPQEKIDWVVDAAAELLESNPNGIIGLLRDDQVNGRNALTALNAALLERGEAGEKKIGNLIAAIGLQGREGLDAGSEKAEQISRNLGFYTGTVQKAIDNETDNARLDAMLKSTSQTIANGVADKLPGTSGIVDGAFIRKAVNEAKDASASNDELKDRIESLGLAWVPGNETNRDAFNASRQTGQS